MIEPARAEDFARKHVSVWNRHDLDEIVELYTEDVELVSPLAGAVAGGTTVRGRDALRAYFEAALKKYPELEFRLIDVLACVDTVTLYYYGAGERVVAEVLTLTPDHRISQVLAHYTVGADFT
jgi:ketosteroid isomerase-like protein